LKRDERVLLRLFADCENEHQAARFGYAVTGLLSAFAPVQTLLPVRYWKIPEYFEFTFSLSPATRATFESLLAINFSENWLHSGDEQESSSVWNRCADACFLLPEVAWAELIFSG